MDVLGFTLFILKLDKDWIDGVPHTLALKTGKGWMELFHFLQDNKRVKSCRVHVYMTSIVTHRTAEHHYILW